MDMSGYKSRSKEVKFLRVLCVFFFLVAAACCAALIVLIVIDGPRKCDSGKDGETGKQDGSGDKNGGSGNGDGSSGGKTSKPEPTSAPTSAPTSPPTTESPTKSKSPPKCDDGYDITPPDPANPGIFQELTEGELKAVKDYMFSKKELDLELQAEAKEAAVNYIIYIDLKVPDKADALAYLNEGAHKPTRLGRVGVAQGKENPPFIREYIVGNLPNPTWHKEREKGSYSVYPIPFIRRQTTDLELSYIQDYVRPQIEGVLRDLLIESYGASFFNCGDKCLQLVESYVDNPEVTTERTFWFFGYYDSTGWYLHHVGFGVLFNSTSMNKEDWHITWAYYNGEYYDNIEALQDTYTKGSLNISKISFPKGEPQFSDMKLHGKNDEFRDTKAPPRLVEPDGRRYKINGRHIQYQGWSFNLGVDTLHGIRFNDLRFKRERVAYEMSTQEAVVFYGGNNPYTWTSFYYDTSEMIGSSLSPLARGVDCPETAHYMDIVTFTTDWVRRKQAICIFEQNDGIPLRRHWADDYAGGYAFYGGKMDTYLVIRGIGNYYNYDYIFDFMFRPNGAIQVRASATGYVQAAFPSEKEKEKGGLLHKDVLGNLHQHFFNIKVDFDIVDEVNRFETIDFSKEDMTATHSGRKFQQPAFKKNLKSTEQEAAMEFDFRKPKYYVIYSNKHINNKTEGSTRTKRGYSIQNAGMTPQMLDRDTNARAAAWANYQVAVTVQKDSESVSSHHYNSMNSKDPVVNFQTFIDDNENIVDKDLVAWISMGKIHLPTTEDSPVTSTTGNQFSAYLRPFNYFEECPSAESRDAIYIDNSDGKETPQTNGVDRTLNCVPDDPPFAFNKK